MSIAGSLTDAINFRYVFTISGTPTTVSGADDNSKTLAYNVGFVDVYLNGVKQVVGTDVTATSGSTLVFASALAANDIVEAVTFDTFTSATAAIVGTRSEFNYVISGTPTTVSGADAGGSTLSYTAGLVDVFLNGVRMKVGTDVTASNGTAVVFASALAAGDLVDIVAHQNFSIANLPASSIGSGTLSNDRLPTGTVLQVVSTTKTDTFSTSTGGSFVDITGLSVAITPRSTSSKIFVLVNTQVGGDEMFYIRLVRGSTAIAVADDDGANRIESTQGGVFQASNNDKAAPMGASFLDSPNTTSETTYKLQVRRHTGGSGLKVNASFSDSDSTFTGRGVSTITAMEVQG
tara:strand:+ start:2421 stop:3464 length:1044 start_codon:yes stop_codon:yes gene_type:complete